MFENETFTSQVAETRTRSTNYLSFTSDINDSFKLKGTIYYQPLFNDFSNYRLSTQINNSVKLSQFITLDHTFQYKYYSHLPQGIKGSDLFFHLQLHYIINVLIYFDTN